MYTRPLPINLSPPVAEALVDRLSFSPATKAPPTSENSDLLRRAEAWASGEQVAAPASPVQAPSVFVGPSDGPDIGPDMGADIVGEPWTDYHDLDGDGWAALKPFLPETMGEDGHSSPTFSGSSPPAGVGRTCPSVSVNSTRPGTGLRS